MFKRILMFIGAILIATAASAHYMPKSYFIGGELVESMPSRADFGNTKFLKENKDDEYIRLWGKDAHVGRSSALGFIAGVRWTDLLDTSVSYHFGRRYHLQSSWDKIKLEKRGENEGDLKEMTTLGDLNAILENKTIHFNVTLNGKGLGMDFGKWEPFVSGGVGIAINRMANVHSSEKIGLDDNEQIKFSWQAMGGMRYYFTEKLNVELGYRFVHFGRFESGDKLLHSKWKLDKGLEFSNKTISPMSGTLFAHEIFMTFIYRIC